jgi:hypothetical protein
MKLEIGFVCELTGMDEKTIKELYKDYGEGIGIADFYKDEKIAKILKLISEIARQNYIYGSNDAINPRGRK